MYRADPADAALLDRLVEAVRAERGAEPSNPPSRGSVLRWLVSKEAAARGLDKLKKAAKR